MNDEYMLEYLLQSGAMRPEEEELLRKQKMVDALRANSMESPQGQMVGKHYVAPSFTQYAAQLGNAYGARKGQQQVDAGMKTFNAKQGQMIKDLQAKIAAKRAAGIPLTEEEQRQAGEGWATFGG